MTLFWKRIAYWLSIIATVMPVVFADHLYTKVAQAPVIGLIAVIMVQIMCTVFFIIVSQEKRFRLAFRWLVIFAGTGFVVLIMTIVCSGFNN